MALIDSDSPIIDESSETTWQDELNNSKILLNKVNLGISTLLTQGHSSYDLSTGQGSQSVRRLSLQELRELRTELLFEISQLEEMLGTKVVNRQIIPGF